MLLERIKRNVTYINFFFQTNIYKLPWYNHITLKILLLKETDDFFFVAIFVEKILLLFQAVFMCIFPTNIPAKY